jgi:hypothetical protein
MGVITQGRGGWVKKNRNRWRWEDIGTAAGRLIWMTRIEQILSAEEPLLKPIARSPYLPQCSCSPACALELSPPGGEEVG